LFALLLSDCCIVLRVSSLKCPSIEASPAKRRSQSMHWKGALSEITLSRATCAAFGSCRATALASVASVISCLSLPFRMADNSYLGSIFSADFPQRFQRREPLSFPEETWLLSVPLNACKAYPDQPLSFFFAATDSVAFPCRNCTILAVS
jgi:hypothetical protein